MANVMPITQNEVFWLWNPSTKSYDREEREITYNRPDQIGVRGDSSLCGMWRRN